MKLIFIFYLPQWEALALLLIGISVNQLRSLPEGASNLGVSVTMGAYVYTLIFVSESCFMARMLAPTYIQASSSPWFLNIFKQLESLLQVTVPSLASVYNEYALKSQYDTSIYLQVILPLCCVKLNLEDKLRCLNRYVFCFTCFLFRKVRIAVHHICSRESTLSWIISVCLELGIIDVGYWVTIPLSHSFSFCDVEVISIEVYINISPLNVHYFCLITETRLLNGGFSIEFQNLFLYGYGAIFNFMGILGTVVMKGKI